MIVIGIAGGSGSGKTTVVNEIKKKFLDESEDNIVVIPQDSYYKDQGHLPLEVRQTLNFDHPDSIDWDLLVRQLKDLKSGRSVEEPTYSYLTCTRQAETVHVEPAEIIIIEGILVFTCKELMDQMDIRVFVDADDDERVMRVIARDIKERGKTIDSVIDRYTKTVKPMFLQYIAPSKRYADIVIPQGGHNAVAINVLFSGIRRLGYKEHGTER